MVLSRNTVHGALLLGSVMLSLAVFYAAQGAPFLAFVQVIVYTGAVMMLFLFVLMLVGVDTRDSLIETLRGQRLAAAVAGIGFLLLLFAGIRQAAITQAPALAEAPKVKDAQGNALAGPGQHLRHRQVAVHPLHLRVRSHQRAAHHGGARRDGARASRAARAASAASWSRCATGSRSARTRRRCPGPGVYARHNAVDTPALLPDGSTSDLSVSPAIEELRLERGRDPRPAQLGSGPTSKHPSSGKGNL